MTRCGWSLLTLLLSLLSRSPLRPLRSPAPPCSPNHDLFKNLVFINKHVQPSGEPCMNDLLHAAYGNITGLLVAQYVTALEQTGDMHIAVFDFGADKLFVANAAPGGAQLAYDATFVEFSMSALWAEPPAGAAEL